MRARARRTRLKASGLLPLEDGLGPHFLAAVDADPITAHLEGQDAALEPAVDVLQDHLLAHQDQRLVGRRVRAALPRGPAGALLHLDRLSRQQAVHRAAVLREGDHRLRAAGEDVALPDLHVARVDDAVRRLLVDHLAAAGLDRRRLLRGPLLGTRVQDRRGAPARGQPPAALGLLHEDDRRGADLVLARAQQRVLAVARGPRGGVVVELAAHEDGRLLPAEHSRAARLSPAGQGVAHVLARRHAARAGPQLDPPAAQLRALALVHDARVAGEGDETGALLVDRAARPGLPPRLGEGYGAVELRPAHCPALRIERGREAVAAHRPGAGPRPAAAAPW